MRTGLTLFILAAVGAIPLPGAYVGRAVETVNIVVESAGQKFGQAMNAADLEVLVDGTPRSVESVVRTDQPATVLLLIDVSSSATWGGANAGGQGVMAPLMGHDRNRTMTAMLRHLVSRLEPRDRLRIGNFGGRELVLSDTYTSDEEQQRKDLRMLFDHEKLSRQYIAPSPIFDVVVAGSRILTSEPEPRAIILVSDGEANGNRYSMSEAALQAAMLRVPVHTICQDPNDTLKAPKGRTVLRPLAEQTGGLFRTDDKGVITIEVAEYFRNIIDAVHATQTIHFTMDAPLTDGPHALEVRAKRRGLQIHAPKWIAAGAAN